MKKRLLCMVLAVVMLFSLSMSAFAAQSDVSIEIDGNAVQFTESSGEPFVDENGRTQVPLRVVMEQYGCKVEWDGANNAAVISKGDTTVIVPIGQSYILVNGKTVSMDTAALIQNGRTYLPIRAVLEAFGAEVEWDNGKVSVTSPASGEFENIYIDEDGNLIFELANGNTINAGSVSNGKDGEDGRDGSDGADGVSVVDAYVNGSGDLMIVLSSGRTINAGNVGVGGNMSGLTFADYSVGTKFYLTQPTGAFSVTVNVGNVPYVVEIDSVYYRLNKKFDYNDTDAWVYKDGSTTFCPYKVAMYIDGKTDTALAGSFVTIVFSSSDDGADWSYKARIDNDGSFSIMYGHGSNGRTPWYAPKTLFLRSVSVSGSSSNPSVPDTPVTPEISEDILEMIAACAGEYAATPDDVVTLKEDGTLIYKGNEYTPEYSSGDSDQLGAFVGEEGLELVFYVSEDKMFALHSGTFYYKDRTWKKVTLTPENFFDYYQFDKEVAEWEYDVWGDFTELTIRQQLSLKDEYRSRFDESLSELTALKVREDGYGCIIANVDSANKTYTITGSENEYSASFTDRISKAGFDADGTVGLNSCWLQEGDGYYGFTEYITDVEVVEVIGTLYLVN